MTPKSRLQAVAAAVGGAVLAAMGTLAVTAEVGTGTDVATINAPSAPNMTLGETITTPTTTTSILSFRPSVTATPPPAAEPGG